MKRADPVPGSRLYVVRHADAGVRGDSADDHLRPLTSEGRDRAHALAELLEAGTDGVIVTSPFTRCVETVEPLAARRRHSVARSDVLAEGGEITAVLDLLRSLPDGSVVCTHGDLMNRLATELEDSRDRRHTAIQLDKGVVWVLSRTNLSLALVDEIGPSTGSARRDERVLQVCAASSAHSRQDDRRSVFHG